jgi:hypothetical protein
MRSQLRTIIEEFDAATERLQRLVAAVPAGDWSRRPDPDRWSVAECVAHLNLTSQAYLPLLHTALAEARALGEPVRGRYRRDLVGWLFWWMTGPPVRFRVRTMAPFVPQGVVPAAELVAEFERLQGEQVRCVVDAEGLPIDRVWVTSPFDARMRYNGYTCLTILPRHQHRHLWQAEGVVARL